MTEMTRTWAVGAVALLSLAYTGAAATIGPALQNRSYVDGAFGVSTIHAAVLPQGHRADVFSFFNDNAANPNWITPLLLDFGGGSTYQITGIGTSRQNTGAGIQSHDFALMSGTSTINSGTRFGWWNGRINAGEYVGNTGVVEFDAAPSDPGFLESCPVQNAGSCMVFPAVGQSIVYANFYGPTSNGGLGAPNGRVYSAQLTTVVTDSAVPEPATAMLVTVAAAGLALLRRLRASGRKLL
jgi:hypothetical protein